MTSELQIANAAPQAWDPTQGQNYQQNPYTDRITQILQQRAQPIQMSPDQINNIGSASVLSAAAGIGHTYADILKAVQAPELAQQDRSLQSAQDLYNVFEQQRSMGNKEAQAFSDAVGKITSDPTDQARLLQYVHNMPGTIDPHNQNQLLMALAKGTKEMGIQTDFQRQLALTKLEMAAKGSEIAKNNAEAQAAGIHTVGFGQNLVNSKGETIASGPSIGMADTPMPSDASGNPLPMDQLVQMPKSAATDHAIAMTAVANGQVKMPYIRSPQAMASWEATTADAMRINPLANANMLANSQKFDTGKQGDTIRTFSVVASHMDTLENLTKALGNGDVRLFNQASNAFKTQFGSAAPTDFNAAKAFIADEVTKGIIGNSGAAGDREQAAQAVMSASSPAQLAGVIDTWKQLMAGQLAGYKQQYEYTTKKNDFMSRLSPEAQSILTQHAPEAPKEAAPITATNSMGHKVVWKDGQWQPM